MFKHITNIVNIYCLCFTGMPCMIYSQSPFIDKSIDYNLRHNYNGNNGGGGVSCVDFNLDGLDDISLASGEGQPIRFYQNNGFGEFEELNLIPDNLFQAKQILWVDYDNDGDKDLFVAAFDGINKLYKNNGDLDLEDVSFTAGIPQDSARTMGANFADFNRDGWLDLYYCERRLVGANTENQNRMFQNNGNGTFKDVSLSTNTSDKNRLPFCSVFADFNNDRWPDIYIANDRGTRNTLLVNFNGFYVDASNESGSGIEMEAMSTALGDYNMDGWLDLYVSNNTAGNRFFVNHLDTVSTLYPIFNEKADELGITVNGDCWGAILFDSNNNSKLDIYVSSALVGLDTVQSVLFEQTDNGTFLSNQNPMSGDTVSSYNNAIGDFNMDGFSDIVVMNKFPFNINLWENQNKNNNWIKVNLRGIISNRDAVGSRLEIYHSGKYQQLYTTTALGFFGQNSDQYIFGLGDSDIIDSLRVTWPTGHVDYFNNLEVNNVYRFYEGESTSDSIQIDSDITILSDTITIDTVNIDTLSIINLINYIKIDCFPNPASSSIFISSHLNISEFQIHAIDLVGRSYKLYGMRNEIFIDHLVEGAYILQLIHQDQFYTSKFLKLD